MVNDLKLVMARWNFWLHYDFLCPCINFGEKLKCDGEITTPNILGLVIEDQNTSKIILGEFIFEFISSRMDFVCLSGWFLNVLVNY